MPLPIHLIMGSKTTGIRAENILFADNTAQSTSVTNTPISSLPGQITQSQLPPIIDIGTF